MDPRVRKIFMILLVVAVIATVVVYFVTDKNMKYTWYAGGTAVALYFLYRFSKQ